MSWRVDSVAHWAFQDGRTLNIWFETDRGWLETELWFDAEQWSLRGAHIAFRAHDLAKSRDDARPLMMEILTLPEASHYDD